MVPVLVVTFETSVDQSSDLGGSWSLTVLFQKNKSLTLSPIQLPLPQCRVSSFTFHEMSAKLSSFWSTCHSAFSSVTLKYKSSEACLLLKKPSPLYELHYKHLSRVSCVFTVQMMFLASHPGSHPCPSVKSTGPWIGPWAHHAFCISVLDAPKALFIHFEIPVRFWDPNQTSPPW